MSVFVDGAAESVVSAYAQALEFVGVIDRFGGRSGQCPLECCSNSRSAWSRCH